jgi:KaiC/GvpD/RAD55 family RecA-like ATPase
MERIPSGIPGLDNTINGGLIPYTVSSIVGTSGTGKTLFCLQFLLEGLRRGEYALYITFEEPKEEILKNAENIGLSEIHDYIESDRLHFIQETGATFASLEQETCKALVEDIKKKTGDKHLRIALDPLTPILWSITSKDKQRMLISRLFRTLKKYGTAIATVEQHTDRFTIEKDVSVPIFLSDYSFMFQYLGLGQEYNRGLKVIKSRGSAHSEGVFPVNIISHFGVIVLSRRQVIRHDRSRRAFEQAIESVESWHGGARKEFLLKKLRGLMANYTEDDPEPILGVIFDTYKS